jgi:hypothetical protein
MSTRKIPTEALVDLQRRLDLHPPRCPERRELILAFGQIIRSVRTHSLSYSEK